MQADGKVTVGTLTYKSFTFHYGDIVPHVFRAYILSKAPASFLWNKTSIVNIEAEDKVPVSSQVKEKQESSNYQSKKLEERETVIIDGSNPALNLDGDLSGKTFVLTGNLTIG